MGIVSSLASVGHQQRDGRVYVLESHTDHLGLVHRVEYLAPIEQTAVERTMILDARALQIDEQLKRQEVELCLSLDRLTTDYTTKADIGARIRELYRTLSNVDLVRIARWIRRRIIAGDFTEDQVRNAFGMDLVQWAAFKLRMQQLDDALAVVEAGRGE